jgi:hypothetical protein
MKERLRENIKWLKKLNLLDVQAEIGVAGLLTDLLFDIWHEGQHDESIEGFLGVTWEEYSLYLENPDKFFTMLLSENI